MNFDLMEEFDRQIGKGSLPDNADAILLNLIQQATGLEKRFLEMQFSTLMQLATCEQLETWKANGR